MRGVDWRAKVGSGLVEPLIYWVASCLKREPQPLYLRTALTAADRAQVLLDSDADGLVTAADLARAARRLCAHAGPALVGKERIDVGDALVALAMHLGCGPSWRAQARALFASYADQREGGLSREELARLLSRQLPGLTAREARCVAWRCCRRRCRGRGKGAMQTPQQGLS
jgi:hypothetical protein